MNFLSPSSDLPSDPQPDWAGSLPREAFHEISLILRGALPPPAADDPADITPQEWARRDRAAMAAVAALLPENAAEGRLAAQFVAADAYALDCLRLAQERRREPEVARRCAAQAMSMMREGKSALRLLLGLQAARRAIADDDAASGRAAWAEHSVVGMMAAALSAPQQRHGAPPASATASGGDSGGVAAADVSKFRRLSNGAINSRKTRSETQARPWPPPGSVASGWAGRD